MPLTKKALHNIVVDAIEAVSDGLTFEETDEAADIVVARLMEEAPELFEDEDEDIETEETSEEE
jgi:divalent metal cation (Fe/Co/Zn/Cd) transporter